MDHAVIFARFILLPLFVFDELLSNSVGKSLNHCGKYIMCVCDFVCLFVVFIVKNITLYFINGWWQRMSSSVELIIIIIMIIIVTITGSTLNNQRLFCSDGHDVSIHVSF